MCTELSIVTDDLFWIMRTRPGMELDEAVSIWEEHHRKFTEKFFSGVLVNTFYSSRVWVNLHPYSTS